MGGRETGLVDIDYTGEHWPLVPCGMVQASLLVPMAASCRTELRMHSAQRLRCHFAEGLAAVVVRVVAFGSRRSRLVAAIASIFPQETAPCRGKETSGSECRPCLVSFAKQ